MSGARMRKRSRASGGLGDYRDYLPPILEGRTTAEMRAAEAAVVADSATPEQIALVQADADACARMIDDAVTPIVPQVIQADRQAREILQRTRLDGLEDFRSYVAANPLDALTVLALLRIATAPDGEAAKMLLQQRASLAAGARHDRPDGSREKQARMRAAWASGKYRSRSDCADKEHTGLGISFETARKALRNTPEPKRRT